MDIAKLKKQYGRLKGIKELLSVQHTTGKNVGDDYNAVVIEIGKAIEEDCNSFLLPSNFYHKGGGTSDFYVQSGTIQAKLFQLMSYLESSFDLTDKIIEIGSIYNSIKDEELKSRCSDILSAPDKFDRVVNQATLVLEDRIRKKSNLGGLVGVDLVNKAINSDLNKSTIKISDNPEEHEGIAHICRGIVLSFRNPTHHQIIKTYTREDALKFCAFVDLLLTIIEKSK